MTTTPKLLIQEIEESMVNPEAVLNSALLVVDTAVALQLQSISTSTPPGAPSDGDAYYVAGTGTGAWTGHDGEIAIYDQGWHFFPTPDGMIAWVLDLGSPDHRKWDGTTWDTFAGGGLADVVDDATPQLGGTLDLNGNAIVEGTPANNITIGDAGWQGSLIVDGNNNEGRLLADGTILRFGTTGSTASLRILPVNETLVSFLLSDSGNDTNMGFGFTCRGTGILSCNNGFSASNGVFKAGDTDEDITIAPNGNGAIKATEDGDARGINAVDLQTTRVNPNMVASGNVSAIVGGQNNRVTGFGAGVAGGSGIALTANYQGCVGGQNHLLSGARSSIVGGRWGNDHGISGVAVQSNDQIANPGDRQKLSVTLGGSTNSATLSEMFINGTDRLVMPADSAWNFTAKVIQIGTTNKDVKTWELQGTILNDAGTVSVVGTVTKTALQDSGGTTGDFDVSATADNVNDALVFECAGSDTGNVHHSISVDITHVGV